MPRPIDLDEENLTPEQKPIYDAILGGPRGIVEGPLRVWLQSPGLADKAQALGAYCRYGTTLPPVLSELAIIVVGAYWRSGFEWAVHAPIALRAGVAPEVVEAIRLGQNPDLPDRRQRAVHDFTRELLENKVVSDETYAEAESALGTTALVELVGIIGYYGLICLTINAFHVPVPEGSEEPFPR